MLQLKKPDSTPVGVQIRHATLTNTVYAVTNMRRPFGDGGYMCNICVGTKHTHKTHHLWLGPDGACLVSTTVLEELQQAGMPGLTVMGHTNTPPPLRVGKEVKPLEQQHDANRKIHVFRSLAGFGKQFWTEQRRVKNG